MVNERVTELTMTFTLNLRHPHCDPCHSGSARSMRQRRKEDTISAGWDGAAAGKPACRGRVSPWRRQAWVIGGRNPPCAG